MPRNTGKKNKNKNKQTQKAKSIAKQQELDKKDVEEVVETEKAPETKTKKPEEKATKTVDTKKTVKETKPKKHWFKDFKAELKKVVWPTGKQLFNNTLAVIVIVIIVSITIFVLDLCFKTIDEQGVNGLKKIVSGTNTQVVENIEATNETTQTDNNVVEE